MKQYHVVTFIPLVIFSFVLFSCGASSFRSPAGLEEAKQAIAAGAQFDNGKFLVLWKKTPKGWKMYRDSFSSNNKQQ